MDKPLLTVLMPVYNAERFLYEAIESVLNQTFRNFEFLIIDDGSTDESETIVCSFSDPRIRFYRNDGNRGITETLNRGIELAKAEYIARMDADDICYAERLEKQYAFINSHPDGALFSCWAKEVTEDRQPIGTSHFPPNHYYYNLTFSCWIYHPTMVYRRDAVKSIGNYTIPYSEDYELAWQLSRKYKMYHLPEVLLEYRVNTQSLWQVTKKQEYRETFFKQVRRNILYYMDDSSISLEEWHLVCLSNYDSAVADVSMDKLLSCITLLDAVSERILIKENPNRDTESIKAAARNKREDMILLFSSKLNYYERLKLITSIRGCNVLYKLILRWLVKLNII
ncbi:glycosyltransferase [Rhodocytophaga rosea]|uniref:Glycosyltransferase n=1 Tax=Rhodocytophaga rosea TaxID=2704465 RepID=A0A6C0GCV6_9BACT|nr:glycosyltransferase [Rhodocytophaga rosea]QHT65785.1 glycosyltransferase [Rhodocytophaga rosea]